MRTLEELKAIQQLLVDAVKSKNAADVMRLIAETSATLNTRACGFLSCHYLGLLADDSLRVFLRSHPELEFNINSCAGGAASGGLRTYAEQLRTQHGADIREIILRARGSYRRFLQGSLNQSLVSATAPANGSSSASSVAGLFSSSLASSSSSSSGEAKSESIGDDSRTIVISLPEDPVLLEQFEPEIDPSCLCPITHSVLTQPVISSDGENYEYRAINKNIETQLEKGHTVTSPITREPLSSINLIPKRDKMRRIRALLDAFLASQKKESQSMLPLRLVSLKRSAQDYHKQKDSRGKNHENNNK